jgi:hypothetical protein
LTKKKDSSFSEEAPENRSVCCTDHPPGSRAQSRTAQAEQKKFFLMRRPGHRQLVFFQCLADLSTGFRFRCRRRPGRTVVPVARIGLE